MASGFTSFGQPPKFCFVCFATSTDLGYNKVWNSQQFVHSEASHLPAQKVFAMPVTIEVAVNGVPTTSDNTGLLTVLLLRPTAHTTVSTLFVPASGNGELTISRN